MVVMVEHSRVLSVFEARPSHWKGEGVGFGTLQIGGSKSSPLSHEPYYLSMRISYTDHLLLAVRRCG